jgi:hypothetical protein
MSTHIQRFVDKLRGSEARGSKDFIMPISEAKDLHADITRLLIDLNSLRQALTTKNTENQPSIVEISGGNF